MSVSLHRGDITTLPIAAIVNAANSSLRGGGGVDGAIHRAAGPRLLAHLENLDATCPPGDAVITPGFDLPAQHVIHTVGPIYDLDDDAPALLARCYTRSLELAVAHGIADVAFSCISTGIYGYPSDEAARVACEAVRASLRKNPSIKSVVFVVFLDKDAEAYEEVLPLVFEPSQLA